MIADRIHKPMLWALLATLLGGVAYALLPFFAGDVAGSTQAISSARPASSVAHCPPLDPPAGSTVTVSTEAELRDQAFNAPAGTTILVAASTYAMQSYVYIVNNGIALRGATGNRDDVILDFGGMSGGQFGILVDADDVTVADLTIRNANDHGVSIQGRDRPVLYNLHIQDIGDQLVKVNPPGDGSNGSDDGLLACSRLEYTTTAPDEYTNGISAHQTHRWTVRDNEWYRIRTPGDSPVPTILFWSGSTDTVVERNLLVDCYQGISFGNPSHGAGDHTGGVVRNNFIYASQRHDVVIEMVHATGWLVANNTALLLNPAPGLSWGMEARYADSTGTFAYNLTNMTIWLNRDSAQGTGTGNVTNAQSSWFANSFPGDLHLAATASAAIDHAATLPEVNDDFDGDARPLGPAPDVGADEYGEPATATPTATASPTLTPTPSATATATATPTPTASVAECVADANGNGVGDVQDVMTTAVTPGCASYLPLVVANWRQPWPTPSPTATAGPTSTGQIQPSDLIYRGAFRLPDVPGDDGHSWKWANWDSALAYYPDGDPGGPNDGFPGSLFGTGHDWNQWVSEVSIPAPVVSPGKNLADLPTAATLQGFANIRGSLFGGTEMPRVGLAYLPAQGDQTGGKLYFSWAGHDPGNAGDTGPSHGWSAPDLAHPQPAGTWRIGGYPKYVTADYMFPIPQNWADTYTSGRPLATGRFRDGGQAAEGPALFAIAPWQQGNPPAAGAVLSVTKLLRYQSVTESNPISMTGYHHSDEWAGGAWLSAGDRAAVIFVGTKGTGDCWYGCADGTVWPDEPPYPPACPERGWWSTGFAGQILFYDPADLAAVAQGEIDSWQPQPYATLNLDPYLYHIASGRQKHHVGAVAFDRTRGLLYVLEPLADDDKPLVHVWQVSGEAGFVPARGDGAGRVRESVPLHPFFARRPAPDTGAVSAAASRL